MKAGDVFRLVKGVDKHAKIVISDATKFPEKVLFVGMTSFDQREDHSCILDKGDHSTIVHRTCVPYSRANAKASNAELDAMVKAGLLHVFEPLSEQVLQRVREGAMKSSRIAKEHKKMLVDQGLADDRDSASERRD